MADKPAAQNKLGQLYVDLGLGGLGNMLSGLNKVSAQFLLTKNTAQQAFTPLKNMFNKFEDGALNVDKLTAAFGENSAYWLKLEKWSKRNLVNFGQMVGMFQTFANLQQKINLGGFTPTQNMINAGFTTDFFEALRGNEPLQTFDVMANKLSDMINSGDVVEVTKARQAIADLGLSAEEMMYVVKQSNGDLTGAVAAQVVATEENIKSLIGLKKEMADFSTGFDTHMQNFLGSIAPQLTSVIRETKDILKNNEGNFKTIAESLVSLTEISLPLVSGILQVLSNTLSVVTDFIKPIAVALKIISKEKSQEEKEEAIKAHERDIIDKYEESKRKFLEGNGSLADKARIFFPLKMYEYSVAREQENQRLDEAFRQKNYYMPTLEEKQRQSLYDGIYNNQNIINQINITDKAKNLVDINQRTIEANTISNNSGSAK